MSKRKKHDGLKIDVFLLSATPSAEISKFAEMIIPRVNIIKILSHDRINIDKYEQQDYKASDKMEVYQNNTHAKTG